MTPQSKRLFHISTYNRLSDDFKAFVQVIDCVKPREETPHGEVFLDLHFLSYLNTRAAIESVIAGARKSDMGTGKGAMAYFPQRGRHPWPRMLRQKERI